MLSNLFWALMGAVFGLVLSQIPRLYSALRDVRQRRLSSRRRELWKTGAIDQWLVSYYERQGSNLYYCNILGNSRFVPVLYDDRTMTIIPIRPQGEEPVVAIPEREHPFPIDNRLLDRRRDLGAVLFKSWRKSLYLDKISYGNGPELVCRPAEYFEIATSLLALEEEGIQAAAASRRRHFRGATRTPIRDGHLANIAFRGARQTSPYSVGSNTVLFIRHSGKTLVAIQTRSDAVITSPGAKAAIPNFGLEPNGYWGQSSKYGLLFYNFMREYLEELFDYEEIIGRSRASQRPDWFFELPEGNHLLRGFENGTCSLTYLGAGVECLSGTLTIAMAALIEDAIVIGDLLAGVNPNYEVAAASTVEAPVSFVDVNDPRLATWHAAGQFQASSSFALSLALKWLSSQNA